MTWWNIVTQILTPILVVFLAIYLGQKIKQGDELKLKASEADSNHRVQVLTMLGIIQRQNGWISRKLAEMIAIHNINHPEARIGMDDYPDSD